jgi:carbamoyltransferase
MNELSPSVYTLGIGDVTHDPSVCLMKDNQISVAIELERLTRIKHNLKLDPAHYSILEQGNHVQNILKKRTVKFREEQFYTAIQYCLEYAGIRFNEISEIVTSTLYEKPVFTDNSTFLEHHHAHSASTFYPSSFDEAAILTVDGYGFLEKDGFAKSVMFAHGKNNTIDILDNIFGYHDYSKEELDQEAHGSHIVFANSLGAFYQNISILVGMGYQGEGKTMGLASYGSVNKDFFFIRKYINFLTTGKIEIDNRGIFLYVSNLLESAKNKLLTQDFFKYKADLAFAAQQLLEEMIIHLALHLHKLTKSTNLCLAGGVALNSVANSKILKKTPFKNIFIQPAAGDSGISIGCGLHGAHAIKNFPRPHIKTNKIFSPYLGKTYRNSEINKDSYNKIEKYRLTLEQNELYHEIAKLISNGKIIGWFNGRSEIGPRALGNRSILADPRDPKLKDILNIKIKFREEFRPFAPAILEEKVEKYFEDITFSPYMLLVTTAKPISKKEIPSVIHVDNTARLQTVNRELSPDFYRLIESFESITEIPVLLNTSFNIAGQPIVETPTEAIDCFINSPLDGLFLNGEFFIKPS